MKALSGLPVLKSMAERSVLSMRPLAQRVQDKLQAAVGAAANVDGLSVAYRRSNGETLTLQERGLTTTLSFHPQTGAVTGTMPGNVLLTPAATSKLLNDPRLTQAMKSISARITAQAQSLGVAKTTTVSDRPVRALEQGKITNWCDSRGFGFVRDSKGRSVFVNERDLQGWPRSMPKVGASVALEVSDLGRGPVARNVRPAAAR